MKTIVSWFGIFCFCGVLSADVAVVFDTRNHVAGEFLDSSTYEERESSLNGWERVDFELRKRGEKLFCSNLDDEELPRLLDPSVTTIICNNTPSWTRGDWREFLARLPGKKVLICWEPPVVLPTMYAKEEFDVFDTVLTWNSKLVDNKRVFQYYYPVLTQFPQERPLLFSERRTLTQISGNKHSSVKNELYSLRYKAIQYFEKHRKKDFCFYGKGWDVKRFRTCGGSVDDKTGALKRFRFSLCFENVHRIKGYITEKMFDCFAAGCVPVYYGASDIESLVPKGCYISWKKFKNFKKLYKFLEKMPENRYNKYLNNINEFLKSKKAQKFSQRCFSERVLVAIAAAKISKNKNFVIKKM